MKTITQEDDQWEAFTLLVWTLGWFWSKNTGQFVQHPMGWGIETLQMFLLTTGHFYFVVWLRSKNGKLWFEKISKISLCQNVGILKRWQNLNGDKNWLQNFLYWTLLNEFISKNFLFFFHWESVVTRDKREVVIGGWSIRKESSNAKKLSENEKKYSEFEQFENVWRINDWGSSVSDREIGSISQIRQ